MSCLIRSRRRSVQGKNLCGAAAAHLASRSWDELWGRAYCRVEDLHKVLEAASCQFHLDYSHLDQDCHSLLFGHMYLSAEVPDRLRDQDDLASQPGKDRGHHGREG